MEDIYDENDELLENYDPDKGYIVDYETIIHHEAIDGKEPVGHYEVEKEYDNGGKDMIFVIDEPGIEARPAWDENIIKKVFHPYTDEELAKREKKKRKRKKSANLRMRNTRFKLHLLPNKLILYLLMTLHLCDGGDYTRIGNLILITKLILRFNIMKGCIAVYKNTLLKMAGNQSLLIVCGRRYAKAIQVGKMTQSHITGI